MHSVFEYVFFSDRFRETASTHVASKAALHLACFTPSELRLGLIFQFSGKLNITFEIFDFF